MSRGFPLQDDGPGMGELFHDLQVEQEQERHDISPGRRCAKCGMLTGGEEAYIDGLSYCHPCADVL